MEENIIKEKSKIYFIFLSNMTDNSAKNLNEIDYSKKFTIFTDGSALGNRKDAPAGFALYFPTTKMLISKGLVGTNNQAELEAMRYCLWYYIQKYIELDIPDNTLYIFSDSEYVINAVTGKHNGKANKAKIEVCKKLIKQIKEKREVEFIHVFAHTKGKDFVSINNEIVDVAARKEAMKMKNKDK
ncbi:MAG: RNase H family protein [Patescibacteria group bacterium]